MNMNTLLPNKLLGTEDTLNWAHVTMFAFTNGNVLTLSTL
jgi:hypothetical protein